MDLIVIGAGGHAVDLTYVSLNDKFTKWNIIGYLDDNPINRYTDQTLGSVSSLDTYLNKYKNLKYTIAINSSLIRKEIDSRYGDIKYAANLVHETAVLGSNCYYDNGLTMGPYSILTTNVQLGRHVHINSASSINQSSFIEDYCTVSPGVRICGDVKVGSATSIGAGAVIINFKTIGQQCTLGAGTVVIDNVGDYTTVVGVPGREIKKFGEYI
jgi:sugar O-acyltransferase (sialic acid O-acetyltransferase NeuD family)